MMAKSRKSKSGWMIPGLRATLVKKLGEEAVSKIDEVYGAQRRGQKIMVAALRGVLSGKRSAKVCDFVRLLLADPEIRKKLEAPKKEGK